MLPFNSTADSPIGATLAYLLLQHKAALGDKRITKITIFRGYKANPSFQADIQLLFHVEDVPEDVLRSDDMDTGVVVFNVYADITKGDVFKRRDSVVEAINLGRNVKRLHQAILIRAVRRRWLVVRLSKFDDAFRVYIHSTLYALGQLPLATYAFLSRLVSTYIGALTTKRERLVCLLLTSLT